MLAGLPWTAWLLFFLSVTVGLTIVLIFYFTHRAASRSSDLRDLKEE